MPCWSICSAPADQPLFLQGKWKFIVLDEAHSYAGAQGVEVGMLMRRLKHRLGKEPGETLCIATSATLTGDDADEAAKFAHALFGESFTADNIIFGQPDHEYVPAVTDPDSLDAHVYLHPRFDELLTELRQVEGPRVVDTALLMEDMELITGNDLAFAEESTASEFLWRVLQRNSDISGLRRYMAAQEDPVAFSDVAATCLTAGWIPKRAETGSISHRVGSDSARIWISPASSGPLPSFRPAAAGVMGLSQPELHRETT